MGRHYLGAALIAVFVPYLHQLVTNDLHQPLLAVQYLQQLGYGADYLPVLFQQLVLLQPGEAVQAHLQNGLGLLRGKLIAAVILQAVGFIQVIRARCGRPSALKHGRDSLRAPSLCHQLLTRFLRVGGSLDQLNHLVYVGQRHGQPFQQMTPGPGAAQQKHGAPGHHLAAVQHKLLQHGLEVEHLGLAIHQRHHVDAEHALQLSLGVKVVQHHLAHLATAQLNHYAGVGGGFIPQLGDALYLFVLDQLGYLLHQPGAVDLVGNLLDDDGLLAGFLVRFNFAPGPYLYAPAACPVGLHYAAPAIDDGSGGEVRPGHHFHQLIHADFRVVNQQQAAVDHFGQVVRGDVGGHANGYAA